MHLTRDDAIRRILAKICRKQLACRAEPGAGLDGESKSIRELFYQGQLISRPAVRLIRSPGQNDTELIDLVMAQRPAEAVEQSDPLGHAGITEFEKHRIIEQCAFSR